MLKLPKTWLFVPANQARRIEKAAQLQADAIILDLEDAVPEAAKQEARAALRHAVMALPGRSVWVRVNGQGSPWFAGDLDAIREIEGIEGIFLPKAERAGELPQAGALARAKAGTLKLGLLIESASGVMNLHAMLCARPDVGAVMFGGAQGGDLMADLGCEWSPEGPEMLHARQHALLAIRAAENVQAIDGVFSALDDAAAFERDTRLSRRLGYRSRAVVHPDQIDPANRIYAPQPEELAWAARIAGEFEAALENGHAAVRIDGRLIDYAMYKMARRVLGSAA